MTRDEFKALQKKNAPIRLRDEMRNNLALAEHAISRLHNMLNDLSKCDTLSENERHLAATVKRAMSKLNNELDRTEGHGY